MLNPNNKNIFTLSMSKKKAFGISLGGLTSARQ